MKFVLRGRLGKVATVLLVERIPLPSLNSTNPAVVDMCKLLTRKGHKVISLTMRNSKPQEDVVETYTFPFHFQRPKHVLKILASLSFSFLAPLYAAYIAKRRSVDVICYNDVVPVFWPVAWFFLRKVKKVHFEGDFITEYISGKGFGRLVYKPVFQIEKWHWNQFDNVAVTSKAFKRLLLKSGIPANRVSVLPESVDNHLFKPDLRKKSEASTESFTVVTHGILTHYKGIDILLRAVRKVMDKGHKLHVTIIGDGPERIPLQNLARTLKIENAVSFVGWVPLECVPNLIKDATVGVVLRRKNLSNDLVLTQALLQYACLRVPILAPDAETIKEEMKHGESLIIYQASNVDDLADKIIFAIENIGLLDSFAERAWQIVMTNHSRETIAERASNICLSVL
jgi:glycosyltransferase involved in cell wall biosynthesis